jgi:FixJ family two-component response regulator
MMEVGMLIYIIDDEVEITETIKDGLELSLEANCEVFHSVDDCLKELDQSKTPAIILSDVHMPTGSGLRMIEELKSRNLKIPLIFITGMMDNIPREENALMIRKPVNLEKLVELIRERT